MSEIKLQRLVNIFTRIQKINNQLEHQFPVITWDNSEFQKTGDNVVLFKITQRYKPYGNNDYYINDRYLDLNDDYSYDEVEGDLSCIEYSFIDEKRLNTLRRETLDSLTDDQKLVLGLK